MTLDELEKEPRIESSPASPLGCHVGRSFNALKREPGMQPHIFMVEENGIVFYAALSEEGEVIPLEEYGRLNRGSD